MWKLPRKQQDVKELSKKLLLESDDFIFQRIQR